MTDPLAPVEAALDRLEETGAAVEDRIRVTDPLRGVGLQARIHQVDLDLALYVLNLVATDGYQVFLRPAGPSTLDLAARPARGDQPRGVFLVDLSGAAIDGTFRPGENAATLARILDVPDDVTDLHPKVLADELNTLGYRPTFQVDGHGVLRIRLQPGRSIRRVRIRGEVPLSERKLKRILSLEARPGALARSACVASARIREDPRPPLCAADDLLCHEWERTELRRLRRFLFDEGYLRGQASLSLVCGRDRGEADLYVFVETGPAYRIPRKNIQITGNVSSRDARWIRRMFHPTVSPFLPVSRRVTRKDMDEARQAVEREYAEPSTSPVGSGQGTRRELEYPYPSVRIETSYDRIDLENPPRRKKLDLEVDVQLGNGVKSSFLGNEHISESRLLGQMQLFKRREPATATTTTREAENLRNYYQARGFMLAKIEGRMPDFGGIGLRQMVFVIQEGPRTKIRKLSIPRPDTVPRKVQNRIFRRFNRDRQLHPRARFTDSNARKDLARLLALYNEAGYLCATARIEVAFWPGGLDEEGSHARLTLSTEFSRPGEPTWIESQIDEAGLAGLRKLDRANVHIRLVVDPGPRVVTSGRETVRYLEVPLPVNRDSDGLPSSTNGNWGAPRMLRDGPLRRGGDERPSGIPVNLTLARDAEREIVQRYRSSGFPVSDASVRFHYRGAQGQEVLSGEADRLASPESGMCVEHRAKAIVPVDTEVAVYEGRKGTFGSTLLRGNFKTRDRVLRRELDWDEGDSYDVRKIDKSARDIDSTGVADGVRMESKPVGCRLDAAGGRDCRVHHVVTMQEAKDVSLIPRFGVGGATLDPTYVFLQPTFPNMWGTGWDLTLDGHWGFDISRLPALTLLSEFASCEGESCYERSARSTLIRRRIFATPVTFSVSASVQERVTPARGKIDSALTEIRLSSPIGDHWQIYGGYLFQIANISKDVVKPEVASDSGCGPAGDEPCSVINRGEAIVPDRTGGLETGVTYQSIDNAFNPNDGFMGSLNFTLASPWLGGWDWWLKFDANWQHFIPIPRTEGRVNFRYSIRYGHAVPLPTGPGTQTTSVPEVWRYFGGGTQDLGLRGMAPQMMLVDLERLENQFGYGRLRPTAIGGHIRLLGTVALQVVSVQKLLGGKLAHSLFFDVGILTQRWSHVRFNRDFRRSVGLNFIKYDVGLVTIALGYAVLIPNAIWPGSVHVTDDRNGRFVFDVGVTF